MTTEKFNIMQISENYVIFFLGMAVAFVGYLLARTMGTFDKRLDRHEAQIAEHDKLISDVHSLQKSNEIQLVSINNQLESIFNKIDDCNKSINHIYEKYDLQIKKQ